jgi:hypothetical protein
LPRHYEMARDALFRQSRDLEREMELLDGAAKQYVPAGEFAPKLGLPQGLHNELMERLRIQARNMHFEREQRVAAIKRAMETMAEGYNVATAALGGEGVADGEHRVPDELARGTDGND